MVNPTVAQTAAALKGVRATGSEADVNAFLCAVERHYGTDHMRAAHKLAGEIAEAERAAAREEAAPAAYKLIGNEVGQYVGGMYRFYCYVAAWPISPAAGAGAVLA
jgi:hypothetical protein